MGHMTKTFLELGLFTGVSQSENFANLKNMLSVREKAPSSNPIAWAEGERIELPETYLTSEGDQSVRELLERTSTSALLIIRDGEIRYEEYFGTGGREVQWLSMSVAKSFVSALIGLLVADGAIRSIDDPITDYITVDAGSAYDGVTIRDILLMSSGARWNEDYSDPNSDALKLGLALGGGDLDLDDFVRGMHKELKPGTVCRYNSGDTQVLGMLIRSVTGGTIAEYMQQKLVEPLGFECPSYWLLDRSGNEAAFAGLNVTARDFARLGELYRLGGAWHGQQVIDAGWVRDSTHITADQCDMPASADFPAIGYGYQWWLPTGGSAGVFTGIGVYNQFVYVDPTTNTTIVKLSANQTYGLSEKESDNLEGANLALLHSLATVTF